MSPEAQAKWDRLPQSAKDRISAEVLKAPAWAQEDVWEDIMSRVQIHGVNPTHGTGH